MASPPPVPPEWTKEKIDDEMRANGVKLDLDKGGYELLKYIGCETELSPKVARAKFTVNEKASEPNGELIRGVIDYVAESLASAAGVHSAESRNALGIELNLNHLRPAYIRQEVTAIATPLKRGSTIQVWEIKFETENMQESATESSVGTREASLIAIARFTLVVQKGKAVKKSAVQSKL